MVESEEELQLWGFLDKDVISEVINRADTVESGKHLRLLNKHWRSNFDGGIKSMSIKVRPSDVSLKCTLAVAASKFTCLSSLIIHDTVNDQTLSPFLNIDDDSPPMDVQMPRLTELTLWTPRVGDSDGLPELKDLKKLTALRFYFPYLSKQVFETLGSLKSLKELSLLGAKVQVSIRDLSSHFDQLNLVDVEMSLKDEEFVDTYIPCLTSLTRLKSLDLGNTKVTDAGMHSLQPLVGLTRLGLSSATNLFGSGDSSWLTHFQNLIALDLSMTSVSDADLHSLNRLTDLQDLDLSETGVQRVSENLTSLHKLVHLNLARSKLIKTGVEEDWDPIVRIPSLRTLVVSTEESESLKSMDLGELRIAVDDAVAGHGIFMHGRRFDHIVDEEIDRIESGEFNNGL
ncbi:hypothetical protein BSKO_10362 [Bryopsis sp. KO-2023]|nr:hypothetical protein BSKO_10362 [Bryopsis sp. KO-2023]